ncbi:hypothetical protein G6F40_015705 [Rhizopus arrhizus]|nr:hypothetical protein G6F40_015705 [Rhizopus arrhizus]
MAVQERQGLLAAGGGVHRQRGHGVRQRHDQCLAEHGVVVDKQYGVHSTSPSEGFSAASCSRAARSDRCIPRAGWACTGRPPGSECGRILDRLRRGGAQLQHRGQHGFARCGRDVQRPLHAGDAGVHAAHAHADTGLPHRRHVEAGAVVFDPQLHLVGLRLRQLQPHAARAAGL